jgi:hypothetical protein
VTRVPVGEGAPRVGILTFHNTPNYGATLQCFALSTYLRSLGASVEVVNYQPTHALVQYAKSLFGGKRRSWRNVRRVTRFAEFVRRHLKLSGGPMFSRRALRRVASRFDLVFTGSDEVWKVDHMRPLDPSFYLDWCDRSTTRTASYAASASTVTDLRRFAGTVTPLLERLDAIAVRDPETAHQVEALTGRQPTHVVDPTMLIDWSRIDLPPLEPGRYIAVYAWLSSTEFAIVRRFAARHGLRVVCVGCVHPDADINHIGIGPEEWLRLVKHAELVVTNFFHGVVFAMLFQCRLFAFVDPAKRMKLHRVLELAGAPASLREGIAEMDSLQLHDLALDPAAVSANLEPHVKRSQAYVQAQLGLSGGRGE